MGHVIFKKNDPRSAVPPTDVAAAFEKLMQKWHQVEMKYNRKVTQSSMDRDYLNQNHKKKNMEQQKVKMVSIVTL